MMLLLSCEVSPEFLRVLTSPDPLHVIAVGDLLMHAHLALTI
jgi:hypothetical protein